MTSTRNALTILALAVALFAMIAALSCWRGRHGLDAETARKLAHAGFGLVTLTYPLVFDQLWPVVVLNALVIAFMVTVRTSRAVARALGCAVHDVGRRSLGEIYFPVAAIVLFALTGGDPVRFCAPILTLTFADAAAAIIGTRYGRSPLAKAFAPKTIEGSAAFFVIAFICVQAPLVALRATDVATSLAVAGGCAAFCTAIEAVCADGADNLFVPLGCYGVIEAMLGRAA